MTSWSLALVFAASVRTLVLPFDDRTEPAREDWKGSAFEEAISSHLLSAGRPVVDVLERNRHLVEMGFLPGEPLTRATAIVLARELGADRVLVGSYRETGGTLEVRARLVDIERGATLGIVEDVGPASDLHALANQLAKNVFRIDRDEAPPGFDACAKRRRAIALSALEASARARLIDDEAERERLFREALSLSPDYLEARLFLGRSLMVGGRTREAIDVLAHAKGEDGIYRAAYFDLGVAYLEQGETGAALVIFSTLSEQERTAAAFNNLGVALIRTERLAEAVAAFEKAHELGGGKGAYAFNLGWGYWRAGKGARALSLFEQSASEDPLDAEARLLLAAALTSQAQPEPAASSRAEALFLSPYLEDVDAATVVGWERTVGRRGAPDDASPLPSIDSAVDVVSLGHLLDARSLRADGRLDDGVRALQRALYRNPGATDVRRELAELHLERGDHAQAASELSVVLWSDPTAEGHVALARVYVAMDEPVKASEQIERALALEPGHPQALDLRAEIELAADTEPGPLLR